MRNVYYGTARANVNYHTKKKWVFVDFDQEQGMKIAMAILRAGLGMKNEPNNFSIRINWDRKKDEENNVGVAIQGQEK
ncbi:MAG TPA: hypothetical protein VNA15_02825 [Candidatus Angelobacter sp.]|nr:hypothetical protein [Candidatus Angelobacter sp.]